MKWLRYADPLFLFDFYDANGRPDHQKWMGAVVVAAVVYCQLANKPLDTSTVIVLGAIGFGPRMFGLYLRGRFPSASTREPEVKP